MAGITIEPFVTAIELEPGPCIVIEVPELPVAYGVTVMALRAQAVPMHIVLLVAGIAISGCLVLI